MELLRSTLPADSIACMYANPICNDTRRHMRNRRIAQSLLTANPATLHLALSVLFVSLQTTLADVITYIRFEEGSGTLAADETGLLDGELHQFSDTTPGGGDTGPEGWSTSVPSSTVPLTGESNAGSIRFSGGSEFIDLSNGNNLSLGTEFTIEFYMFPESPIAQPIFGFEPSSDLFLSLTTSSGDLFFNSQFMSELVFTPADSVQVNEWQHVAFVKEPGQYTIYLDGNVLVTDPLPASTDGPYSFPGTDFTGDRTIGGESGTWRGYLDEFRISDTALTPDQFLIAVPEPSTFLLVGLAGLLFARRRMRSSS